VQPYQGAAIGRRRLLGALAKDEQRDDGGGGELVQHDRRRAIADETGRHGHVGFLSGEGAIIPRPYVAVLAAT
ncbi:hypothetical protein, partial [Mycobacterium tuberculosis]|uniref:hypothetical protein n=1 Tax=Mycobacterium tuberculosis TaxID=1773 RepID=UPI001AE88EB3